MEDVPQPPRRLPPEVYRRRRIVVVLALVVLIAVVWLVVRALTSSPDDAATPAASPSPTDTPSPTASPSPEPSESPAAAASGSDVPACTATDVAIAMSATPTINSDAATFDITVTQTGASECLLDGSTADTSLLITSGDVRVWRSTDCEATSAVVGTRWLLQPGATEAFTVTWPREWSGEGCVAPSTTPPANGTYWAELTVQGITAERQPFDLS